ncbi:hypothetical protein [Streptomyces sp. NPDC021622]|uniref:hypothetical protein n=1 Tax=Streptomyces sp. NPDC021622 TaxID=3155013 RepID=UPI0033DC665E
MHSRYQRGLAELPVGGGEVVVRLTVRRFQRQDVMGRRPLRQRRRCHRRADAPVPARARFQPGSSSPWVRRCGRGIASGGSVGACGPELGGEQWRWVTRCGGRGTAGSRFLTDRPVSSGGGTFHPFVLCTPVQGPYPDCELGHDMPRIGVDPSSSCPGNTMVTLRYSRVCGDGVTQLVITVRFSVWRACVFVQSARLSSRHQWASGQPLTIALHSSPQ